MTREEMVGRSFKTYMIIEYKDEGMKHSAECLLISIDFDAELLKLCPLNDFYEQKEFFANLKFCEFSKRLKAATIEGKKQNDLHENIIKSKVFEP